MVGDVLPDKLSDNFTVRRESFIVNTSYIAK